tara:strand:+ start:59380 stop:59652 length:273 start_codon:yes stop_codon:yes gene_type:complete
MTSHLYRFVRGKALISSVFAIALFSGLALILSQGRDTGILSVIFLVAGIVALLFILHAITVLAQRTMGSSITPLRETQKNKNDSESDSSH